MERNLNDWTDCTFEVGTCSGRVYEEASQLRDRFSFEMGTCSAHVYIKRLLKDVTDCPFEMGTCFAHVYMERLLNDVIDCPFEAGTCSGRVYLALMILKCFFVKICAIQWTKVNLFDLFLYVHSTIFQLCGTVLPGFNQY